MSPTCSDCRGRGPGLELRPASGHAWLIAAAVLCAVLFLPSLAAAQALTLDLGGGADAGGDDGSLTGRIVQLFLLVTLLSIAPGIAIMVTCFPFMVTVLALLRQAIGLQQAPPNMLIVSLAMFLTYFVMEPVFTEAWTTALQPLLDGDIDPDQAFERGIIPFRAFMESRVSPDAVATLLDAAPARAPLQPGEAAPISVLVPAFMLSELERGFEVGFMIFLPFLVIDLVVASVLMSMGMMMVPPVVVSLPLKLAFFVVADGWTLLAGALIRGYST